MASSPSDKKAGLIPFESGRVNASISFDIYLGAQSAGPEALPTRRYRSTGKPEDVARTAEDHIREG
ncbi:hypothetical protein FOTG_17503 [Fusarium oxysporum f. sp. vasinfectum 25433]|uniref:Uncharacterized protein n=1 Tax=Fusarium oxysporum f. sp. vasinfectum 25433 TaxID=1089449 RepID=X0KZH6_FUSOX|nr:hypothetical protein FOTG_17503 [Fusarium oxysporum f. sp. vasinfectum 25433]